MLLYLYFKIAGTLCPLRLPHSLYVMPAEIVTDETRLSNVFHVFPHSLIRLINKTRVNNATRWPTIKGPKAWNMTHNRTHKDWTSHGNATNGESCSSMVDCVIMSLQCCLSTSPSWMYLCKLVPCIYIFLMVWNCLATLRSLRASLHYDIPLSFPPIFEGQRRGLMGERKGWGYIISNSKGAYDYCKHVLVNWPEIFFIYTQGDYVGHGLEPHMEWDPGLLDACWQCYPDRGSFLQEYHQEQHHFRWGFRAGSDPSGLASIVILHKC